MEGDDPEWTWIMPKITAAVTALILALGLAGCAGGTSSVEPTSEARGFAAPIDSAPATEAPVEQVDTAEQRDITAKGEVCDPHNLNDAICAAFHPDQVALNMTSPERVREPLASMSPESRLSLAHDACENLNAGNREHLIDTILRDDDDPLLNDRNNGSVYSAAAMAYCHQHIEGGTDEYPDRNKRIVKFYQSLGEAAAKDHFSGKVMPTPEELGY